MKGSGLARVVIAAPAKAEDRLGRVCERTICGGIEFDFFNQILISTVNCGVLGVMHVPLRRGFRGEVKY
jgi:hypothetical protein